MTTNIGRNQKIFGSLAAIAIVAGLILVSGMSKAAPAPPAAPQSAAQPTGTTAESSGQESQTFLVRDYSAFSDTTGVDLPSSNWLGDIAGMGVKLALVVGLIYVIFIFLKRYANRGKAPVQGKKPVSLLSSLNLSPSRTIYVLEVGKKLLVVGATQNQLSLLTEVTDPETVDEVRNQTTGPSPMGQFSSFLGAARKQFGTRGASTHEESESSSLQAKFDDGLEFMQDRLDSLRLSLGRKSTH